MIVGRTQKAGYNPKFTRKSYQIFGCQSRNSTRCGKESNSDRTGALRGGSEVQIRPVGMPNGRIRQAARNIRMLH
jgi:hypothetical protein